MTEKQCGHKSRIVTGCPDCLARTVAQMQAWKEAAELADGRVKCTCDDGYHDRCPLMQFEAAMENARTMGES